jgi:arsenate reductase (thioredoxin)
MTKPRVVFVCTENSCRSQMAEGFAKILGLGQIEVNSAGSKPAGLVNLQAIRMMSEKNIDLGTQAPKGLDDLPFKDWDYAVTLGCGDSCPALASRNQLAWDIPDPKGLPDSAFREVRDLIEQKVRLLIHVILSESAASASASEPDERHAPSVR